LYGAEEMNLEKVAQMETPTVALKLARVCESYDHIYIYHRKLVPAIRTLRRIYQKEYHKRLHGRHYNDR
jgi:hypothetical protein